MSLGEYNGWSGKIRTVRGNRFYRLITHKKIAPAIKCELCGSRAGMTYHAEEYGSTWEDYVASCHQLCSYCHGMMHVRFDFPNRWHRFCYRVGHESHPFVFENLGLFFKAVRLITDIPEFPPSLSGVAWVDRLETTPYAGPPKLALSWTDKGTLVPDPSCYDLVDSLDLKGLRYTAEDGKLTPYP